MARAQAVGISLFGLLLAGCSGFHTSFDYDTEADFGRLRTYDWVENRAVKEPLELVHRRAVEAANGALQAKGYQLATASPDFLMAVHYGSEERIQVSDMGYGYGPRGRYYGGGLDVYSYTEGTLVLDVVDAKTRELLWRGSATGVVDRRADAEQRNARVREVVAELLAGFPPGR